MGANQRLLCTSAPYLSVTRRVRQSGPRTEGNLGTQQE